jgi:hypothetical protein
MPTLVARIADKMTPHVRAESEQRALLDAALYGFNSVRGKIPLGLPADQFATQCASKLLDHGKLADGSHPLARVLATLRDGLGHDPEWDVLIAEIEAGLATPPAGPALPDKQRIRDVLVGHFSHDELRTLAFDLSIDDEDIPGATKGEFARELVQYCAHRDRLAALVSAIRKQRPGAL